MDITDIAQIDVVRLLILILPGLWGLWVYRSFFYTGKDEDRGLDYGRAAGFGIIGYMVAIWYMGETPKEGISKTVFLLKQFGMSALVSVSLAIFLGGISRYFRMNLVFLPTKLYSKIFKKTAITPNSDSGIATIWRNYIDHKEIEGKKYTNVAIIYSLTEPEKKLVGEINEIPSTNEIIVDKTHISADRFDKFLDEHSTRCRAWQKNINLDNGIVTEIITVEENVVTELQTEFYGEA